MKKLSLYHDEIVDAIGPFKLIESLRESSSRTSVYKLKANEGYYYLKLFSRRARFEPEIFAYNSWNKIFPEFTPKLIKVLDGKSEFGLIMTEIEGTILREAKMSKEEEYASYRKAGELTRLLQDSQIGEYFGRPSIKGNPIEDSFIDAYSYLEESLNELEDDLIKEALMSKTNADLLEAARAKLHLFTGEVPVPVSWDSTPGNWIVDQNNIFKGMIDFENMRWGIRTDSFGILYERYFLDDMNREKAFFEGYGLDYLENEKEKITFALIKIALSDLYYGSKFNNDRSLEMGNRLVKYLRNTAIKSINSI